MTYQELLQAAQHGLPELLRKELPIKVAMRLRVLSRRVNAELETYEEMRLALVEKHALRGEDGERLPPEEGKHKVAPAFWEELNELLETEAPEIPPVRVEELGEVTVTTACLMAMGGLLLDAES